MSAPAKSARPIQRQSLADQVHQRLLEEILDGSLPPGAELSAVQLADRLQVSRTPVTEAIQRLAYEGLVEQPANHQPRVHRPTADAVREIYEMRACLEGTAAERSARLLGVADLADLRSRLDALRTEVEKSDWAARAIDFDLHFHARLAAAAGNGRLEADIARYRRLVRCFCRMTGSRSNLHAALDEHDAVLAALEARRPAAARKAMTVHIENRLRAVLEELFPAPAP